MRKPTKVLLAYVPMGLIQLPSLGLSLLKAGCRRADLDCSIRYFNFEMIERFFSSQASEAARHYVAATTNYRMAFAAESIFADLYYGPDRNRALRFHELIAEADEPLRSFLQHLREIAPDLVAHCLRSVDWDNVSVLGLSSTFIGMTLPAALLARTVKAHHPHVITVLGGPNTEGPMGIAVARSFAEFDYILRGEADHTFPELVRRVLAGEAPDGLPGLVMRSHDGTTRAWPARPVARLDELPVPDFDDFMRHAREGPLASRFAARMELPFESSRGCWWGEVSHCKFCGINGEGMGFRAKAPDRVLEEIEALNRRYRPQRFFAADAILDRSYFETLLPALADRKWPVSLSYEIKANLRDKQVARLAAAGVDEILPGIECFSTPLLKRMAKGATALDNVLCLRLSEEHDIRVRWYFMIGLPGETASDTDQNLTVIGRIPHLQPPRQIARFTLQRFTPYFQEPDAHGIDRIRPLREYRAVFALDDATIAELAYHFEFDFTDGRDLDFTARNESRASAAIAEWTEAYPGPRLDMWSGARTVAILDTRAQRHLLYIMTGTAVGIQADLAQPTTLSQLVAKAPDLRRRYAASFMAKLVPEIDLLHDPALAPAVKAARSAHAEIVAIPDPLAKPLTTDGAARAALQSHLDSLVDAGLVLQEGKRYLSLAVRRNGCDPSADPGSVVDNQVEGSLT